MKTSLKTKIIAPVIVVLLLLILVVFVFVSIHTTNLANTLSNERMLGAAQTARIHLEGLMEQSRIVAHSTSINVKLIEYLHDRNRDDMLEFLLYQANHYGVDAFVVTFETGEVFLRSHAPERYGDDGSTSPGIAYAMEGKTSSVYTSNPSFAMGLSSTSPIYDEEGNIIGTIVANYNLTIETYVDAFAEMFNAEVAFFADSETSSFGHEREVRAFVTSTSFRDENGERSFEYMPPDEVIRTVLDRGEEFNHIIMLYGGEYHVFYSPLFGHVNETVGMFSIGFSREQTNLAISALQLTVIIFGAISLLIATALVFLILAKFLNPLERLTKNVLQISDTYTDTATIYGGNRNDEIGDLSRNIQHMWNALKSMTQEVEASLEIARAASKSKSRFLSNMSHEIRTPMNAIIGMGAIGKSSADMERKDYALEKIENAASHLLGIINDVLDMSKIEAGKFELSPVIFNFEKTINKAVDIISFHMSERNQTMIVNLDPAIPGYVIGDNQRFMQVITNLLSNAVKFTPDNGRVTLNVSLKREENQTCIIQADVIDTGIGMNEEQQKRVFDSFEQAENDTTRKYGGTGLGLAISKQIVEFMDGEIWIESVPGQGSKFSFTVALTRSDSPEHTETAPVIGAGNVSDVSNVSFEGFCILLAEDVEINSEIIIGLLECTGIEIDCAENGKKAVEKFNADPEKYDLIFMDMQMPEMDGFEATRQIRAAQAASAKRVPIVAMTANVFKEEIQQCLDAGMDDHIGKPIDPSLLFEKLQKYLTP